ncbi:MAG: aspartate-semialdehyde dehydrogenase [Oscillospiraceae bacterium]
MIKNLNIAVLGATGAVGCEMVRILEERGFPIGKLRLLASGRSAGREILYGKTKLYVEEAREGSFDDMDIVLGVASNELAAKYAPSIKRAGAVFVDNSSAFRMRDDVPLVIPEINGGDVRLHNGIISNPNCSTIIALMAINGINTLSPITHMIASTYQAVSGAGANGILELEAQIKESANGDNPTVNLFQHQIVCNLIPQIGSFGADGYTTEEMKMQNEGRKILHLPNLKVSCTCVRVPVMRSHSISINVFTKSAIDVAEARAAIAKMAGCRLVDDPENSVYPMPLETSDQDAVFVGRMRRDLTDDRGISLWCCGDQLRKGAATNAVQIAELVARL